MTDYGDLVADVVDSWNTGEEPDSKRVFEQHPEILEYEKHVLELATEECRIRYSRGDEIVPGEFCRKFSSHSHTVRRILEFQSAVAGSMERARPDELWPDSEDRVLNFELVREIGRGATSRVFTARESDLGDRIVAVKLTSCRSDEAATLVPQTAIAMTPEPVFL